MSLNNDEDPVEGSSQNFFSHHPKNTTPRKRRLSPPPGPPTPPLPPFPPLSQQPPTHQKAPFREFNYLSTDTKGFPFTPDFLKAENDGTLLSSDAAEIVPEPHLTAKRFLPKSHEKVNNQPEFVGPVPFEFRLGEKIKVKVNGQEQQQQQKQDLDGNRPRTMNEVLDKGMLNTTSNFILTRLPGYKSIRKQNQYARDMLQEPPALINMICEHPQDGNRERQLNSSVTDILNAGTCTSLLTEPNLRVPILNPRDTYAQKCCKVNKKREATRSFLAKEMGARTIKTRYSCGSFDKESRFQFQSPIDIAKKSAEGEDLIYFFSVLIVQPVEYGTHESTLEALIKQRRQTPPSSLRQGFHPKLFNLEVGIAKLHSSLQRSRELALKRKYHGRKSDKSNLDSGTDDDSGEDLHFRRSRNRKTHFLARIIKNEYDEDDDENDGEDTFHRVNKEGSNPEITGPPIPNLTQAHIMAGFAKLLWLKGKIQHRNPMLPLAGPSSIAHPMFLWKHSIHNRNGLTVEIMLQVLFHPGSTLLDQFWEDTRYREPYQTFMSNLPSMTVQRLLIQSNTDLRSWTQEFHEEARERANIVLTDHRNLRHHQTLNSPVSLSRAINLW